MFKQFHVSSIVLVLIFAASAVFAEPGNNRGRIQERLDANGDFSDRYMKDELDKYAREQAAQKFDLPTQVMQNSTVLTDSVMHQIENGEWMPVMYRDEEVLRVMDVLVRHDGRYPVVVGEVGAGKTSVINSLTHKIVTQAFPSGIYKDVLQDTVILRASARSFAVADGPQGMDFAAYFYGVRAMAKDLGLKIVIVLTEPQYLEQYHTTVLHENAQGERHIPVIIESDSKTFTSNVNGLASLNRLLSPVRIEEFKRSQIIEIAKETMVPLLESRHNLRVSDDLLQSIADISGDYRRDLGEPARTFLLLEDFLINYSRQEKANTKAPTKVDMFKFVAKQTGVPVVPQDEKAFIEYMENLRVQLKKEVVSQDHIVDGLVDQFRTALTSRTRHHSIAMIMGSTGVGKTYTAERLAELFYGSKSRVLEVDMTQFMDEHKANVLFGAGNGYVSADTDKGVLCEFLDGRGKGGGIIVLNELEKAHSSIITRMMELFDKGEIRGGDGRVRYLGRSLIVMTSNKGTERILPYEAIRGMDRAEREARLKKITGEDLKRAFTEKSSYTESENKVVAEPVVERIDKFYFAMPLVTEDAIQVAKKETEKFARNFEKQGVRKLKVEDSFAETITTAFYNEAKGARQLKLAIEQSISNAIEAHKKQHGYDTKGYVVSASLHPTKKTESFITVVDANDPSKTTTVDGPRVPVDNKLLDVEFRVRLQKLEENMGKEIFGQPEAVKAVVAAAQSRFLKAGKQKPASGFLIGTTGTGKSQMAKSLAKNLYGREDAYALFDMGSVKHEHDLSNILSPPKGSIGSDQPAELEQFLLKFPEGGVLLFDEMSNAGGKDRAQKEAIAKRFYKLLEEGVYVNAGGKKYDLSNYVFIFTGNDGEKLFKGITNDDTIDDIYQDATEHPEKIKDLLREAGFSDAFLGRLAFASLMRPATGESKVRIAGKMIKEWSEEVTKSQPVDIVYTEEFVKEAGDLLFTPNAGARSISHFINNHVGPIVTSEILKLNFDELIENGERAQIKVSITVEKPTRPFYENDKPDVTKAVVVIVAEQHGREVARAESEFTDSAFFMPQLHINRARATAYHEMGHAVAAFTEFTGGKVSRVTIVPQRVQGGMAAGVTFYDRIDTKHKDNWDVLVMHIACMLAGSEAEVLLAGGDENVRSTGRSSDVDRAGKIARQMIVDGHLVTELDGISAYMDQNGNLLPTMPQKMREILNAKVDQAIEAGRKLAQAHLRQNWHVVHAGAELLLKHHTISGEDYERLVERAEAAKAAATREQRQAVDEGTVRADEVYKFSLEGIVVKKNNNKGQAASQPQQTGNACRELLSSKAG